MLRRVIDGLSYERVVSTLCLFLILGGGAWAATSLPNNSVGTRQLKNDAVRGSKIAPESIRASDIGGAVTRARWAKHASDAETLGGNIAGDFLPRSAVRSFNEGVGGCSHFCAESVPVISAVGWDMKAECVLNQEGGWYNLRLERQTSEGQVDYFVSDDGSVKSGTSDAGFLSFPTGRAHDGAPASGFGTLFMTGEGLYATVNFQYSMTLTNDEMSCRTYGVVVQPPPPS